jgi:HD-GYP domain-containing protein (c-di-GMP phosphodiesterase class II)
MADVYDALTSKRVYKPAFSHDIARSMILEASGKHFDPRLVQVFIDMEEQFVAIQEKRAHRNAAPTDAVRANTCLEECWSAQ